MKNFNDWAQQAINTQNCQIDAFRGQPEIQERLQEMGMHIGLVLTLKGRAPWKGPWLVEFSETVLALREEEAACLSVKPL